MNRQQFYEWMNDPASLDAGSLHELQQVMADYPYFQAARLLYLLNLRKLEDYHFDNELRSAAFFAPDRTRLREWLGILSSSDKIPAQPAEKPDAAEVAEAKEANAHLKALEEQIKASLDEIERKKTELQELLEEKKAIVGEKEYQADEAPVSGKEFNLRPLPKDKMLEDFLLQNPSLPDGRATFYSPEESAKKSIEENDGILSETLARLIAAQGKKDKAIKIYQQLMLKNPQKSSYFAAQIEKLRKES